MVNRYRYGMIHTSRKYLTTIILLAVFFSIPVIAAAETVNPDPAAATANETPVFNTASLGNGAPTEYHETDPTIMIFRIELPQTEYPGPRDMAFGPRYIQLTTNLAAIVIIGVAAVVAVLAFVICRRRKAGASTADAAEDKTEICNGKQE
ncbi:MAG: hypothetical protein A4E35_00538 [Methanoregula sp. PtaU1.Bin051]|nr:MAG: hypothetical protein A4E35_00538 [Methanoregula sp. PtaU1.Bin051]